MIHERNDQRVIEVQGKEEPCDGTISAEKAKLVNKPRRIKWRRRELRYWRKPSGDWLEVKGDRRF